MVNLLQTFDITSSHYNRPNQTWVCGYRQDGRECLQGPDENGACHVKAECEPRRDGDRWHCTRSKAEGGTCDHGPNPDGSCCLAIAPCQPTRSLRSRRGLFSIWLATIIASLIVLVFAVNKSWLLNPGELSSKHASLENCNTCHTNFDSTVTTWLHQAVTLTPGDDANACLDCHNLGKSALLAHSLEAKELMGLTIRRELLLTGMTTFDSSDRTVNSSFGNSAAPSCGVCHREHKGLENTALSQLSDEACHNCHVVKFDRFANGHPSFDDYPFTRRTRIQFDHSSHISRHFKETELADLAPKGCLDCHQTDAHGQTMEVIAYDATCSGCHDEQIRGTGRAGAKGITVMAVPEIDTDSLLNAGLDPGDWPAGGAESIPPLLDFMLAADEEYRQARAVTHNLDLYDLSDATSEQIVSAARIAWAIKQFYYDAVRQGPGFFQRRIETVTGTAISRQQLIALLSLLPRRTLAEVEQSIFPNLGAEVEKFRAAPVMMLTLTAEPRDSEPWKAETTPNVIEAAATEIDFSDEISLDDDIDFGDEIDLDDDLLGDDEISLDDDLSGDDGISLDDDTTSSPEYVPQSRYVDHEQWAATGGWYWENLALTYRPTGHADAFLTSWIEIAGSVQTDVATRVATVLTGDTAVGSCSKCHSTDALESGSYRVNWHGRKTDLALKSFTHFSHQTHADLMSENGCLTCHQTNPDVNYAAAFEGMDANQFESNFVPINQATCASCHQSPMAGDNCLLCHNYHVGEFPAAMLDMDDQL